MSTASVRDRGRLKDWNDDKGFGFVTPDEGGLKAFVHIKAFSDRRRRPRAGDVITYQLGWDKSGRARAQNVLFYATHPQTAATETATGGVTDALAYVFAVLCVLGVITFAVQGKLPFIFAIAYVVMSLVTFLLYAFDKSAAMNRRWRTKESALHLLSLLGGWPGALFAQRMFHHKSKKLEFQFVFWFVVALHFVVLTAWIAGWLDQYLQNIFPQGLSE